MTLGLRFLLKFNTTSFNFSRESSELRLKDLKELFLFFTQYTWCILNLYKEDINFILKIHNEAKPKDFRFQFMPY